MSNSSINIGSNKICGTNLGTGSTVYACNNPFNTLNFKSISVASTNGMLSISTGDTIIISADTTTIASTSDNGITIANGNVSLGGLLTGITILDTQNSHSIGIGNALTILSNSENSIIAGGNLNSINLNSENSIIAGGISNSTTCSIRTGIMGGYSNLINAISTNSIIAGGGGNSITCTSSGSIVGSNGGQILPNSTNTTIIGSSGSVASGIISGFIGGSIEVTMSGGVTNSCSNSIVSSYSSCIVGSCGGSSYNTLIGQFSSCIVNNNTNNGKKNALIGGENNTQNDSCNSSIISSYNSLMSCGINTSILGGYSNSITFDGVTNTSNSVIIGGNSNTLSGTSGTIVLGGSNGIIDSDYNNHTVVQGLAIITAPSAGGSNDLLTWESGATGTGIVRKVTQASISDSRLKTNLKSINNPLEGILSLNGYEYEFNDKIKPENLIGKKRYGLIAQEVENKFPLVVNDNLQFGDDIYKTVEYRELVPILIEAIKELNDKITKLENK